MGCLRYLLTGLGDVDERRSIELDNGWGHLVSRRLVHPEWHRHWHRLAEARGKADAAAVARR